MSPKPRSPLHRFTRRLTVPGVLALTVLAGPFVEAQSLLGSKASLLRQNEMARQHDFTYLRTSGDVHDFVDRGLLVRLPGDSNYRLGTVSFPYARREVKTFVERLGSQYRDACGERLVVTSLTRPSTRQPRNASHLSVHPTGMAMDLRRSDRASCRRFLEETLLALEERDILEATRERHPPHYHVTLYPTPYKQYLAGKGVDTDITTAKSTTTTTASASTASGAKKYRVGRGDSLWSIAQRHKTSVISIKKASGLSSSRLKPGQVLRIPTAR